MRIAPTHRGELMLRGRRHGCHPPDRPVSSIWECPGQGAAGDTASKIPHHQFWRTRGKRVGREAAPHASVLTARAGYARQGSSTAENSLHGKLSGWRQRCKAGGRSDRPSRLSPSGAPDYPNTAHSTTIAPTTIARLIARSNQRMRSPSCRGILTYPSISHARPA